MPYPPMARISGVRLGAVGAVNVWQGSGGPPMMDGRARRVFVCLNE